MNRLWGAVAGIVAGLALLAGCDQHDGHKHEEKGHGAHGGTVAVPDHYKDAVAKCEELSGTIGSHIAAGHLNEVHAAAADIKKIAEKLPELAQKELKAEMLKDINVAAKALAGMFDEIDAAADGGKKEETQKLHEKMKGLIAELKRHAAGDHHDH